jgi:hypothetical protein
MDAKRARAARARHAAPRVASPTNVRPASPSNKKSVKKIKPMVLTVSGMQKHGTGVPTYKAHKKKLLPGDKGYQSPAQIAVDMEKNKKRLNVAKAKMHLKKQEIGQRKSNWEIFKKRMQSKWQYWRGLKLPPSWPEDHPTQVRWASFPCVCVLSCSHERMNLPHPPTTARRLPSKSSASVAGTSSSWQTTSSLWTSTAAGRSQRWSFWSSCE